MITDGFDLVLDLEKSKGCQVYDSKAKKFKLDCFAFFASAPVGSNHPKLTTPEFIKKIGAGSIKIPEINYNFFKNIDGIKFGNCWVR